MGPPTTLEGLIAEAQELRTRLEEIETLIRLATKYRLAANPARQVTGDSALNALNDQMGFGTTMKDKIINGAEHVLSDGKRRVSREIVADLATMGVIVPGSDPAGYLATYLSKEKARFTSDLKAGGWTLRRLAPSRRSEDHGAPSRPFNT